MLSSCKSVDKPIEKEENISELEKYENTTTDIDAQKEANVATAREKVIQKWASNDSDTDKYIEDIYKQYPDDDTIANIYFYSVAKSQYGYYKSLDNPKYLESAKEYAKNIDPNYDGELSVEIHKFEKELLAEKSEERETSYSQAKEKTDKYNSLTNSEKKAICDYIQSRYDYYDSISGGYAGDKYSNKIWQEAAKKYGLTEDQISIIWMNMYQY